MRSRRVLLAGATLLFLIGAIYYDRIFFRPSLSSFISDEFKVEPQGEHSNSSLHTNNRASSSAVDPSSWVNVQSRLNLTTRFKASSIQQSLQTNDADTTANNNAIFFTSSAPKTAATTAPSAHNIHRTANTDTATNTQSATIVVQLSGEMGNQLSKIAHGHALFLWLKREFGLEATVILRHQEKPKWLSARENVQKCFPATRSYDFSAANTLEFQNRSRQQSAWLGSSLDSINNPESVANVSRALQLFAQFNRSGVHEQHSSSNSNISLPFLYSDLLVMDDLFMDRFYDDYRELFRFDPACCQHRPEPDESVFVSVVRQTTSSIPWCFAHYVVRCVFVYCFGSTFATISGKCREKEDVWGMKNCRPTRRLVKSLDIWGGVTRWPLPRVLILPLHARTLRLWNKGVFRFA
jgi:hypothetical protein